jgi:hypothetical protein
MNLPRNGELSRLYQVIGIAVVGLAAGGGGSLAVDAINPPRPDPFTGSMGRELRADMMRNLESHDARLRILESIAGGCGKSMEHLAETLRELKAEMRALERGRQP